MLKTLLLHTVIGLFIGILEDVECILMRDTIKSMFFKPSMRSFLITIRRLIVIPLNHTRIVTFTLSLYHLMPILRMSLRTAPPLLNIALTSHRIMTRFRPYRLSIIGIVILIEVTSRLRMSHNCLWLILP